MLEDDVEQMPLGECNAWLLLTVVVLLLALKLLPCARVLSFSLFQSQTNEAGPSVLEVELLVLLLPQLVVGNGSLLVATPSDLENSCNDTLFAANVPI